MSATHETNVRIHSEIKKMAHTHKADIISMEFKFNSITYKTKELNALINEDNVNKLREVNNIDIHDAGRVQRILAESPDIKLLNEYLDELKRDADAIKLELERKRSFYERVKRHIYTFCDHLWISDHFENPASMSMVGCTYCNVCGLVRDDV
jgi:hypothetical protein